MKILIIMHSSNTVYGAAKSLQKLIEFCNWDIDLIYPKSHFHPVSAEIIKEFVNKKDSKIYSLYLPFREKVVYNRKFTIKEKIWEILKRIFEFKDSFKLNKLIKEGNYDYILLNSIVLYPLISKSYKCIMYIREMIVQNKKIHNRVKRRLKKAKKIIFIDNAITVPFSNDQLSYKVINNPFDMRSVNKTNREDTQKKYKFDHKQIVISLIGTLSVDKGIDFVINAVNKLERDDIVLLIVGNGNLYYVNKCKSLSKNSKRILFLGEMNNLDEIYSLSDYVIRADDFFATGRTVYEGLYSGCNIILQKGKKDKPEMISEFETFADRISFYEIRDENSLISVLNRIKKINKSVGCASSNVNSYIEQVNQYI